MLGGNPPRRASERSGRTDSIGWPARRSSSSPRAHHASCPGPLHPLQLWPQEGRLERLATRTRRMANWHRPTLQFQSVPHDGKNRICKSCSRRVWKATNLDRERVQVRSIPTPPPAHGGRAPPTHRTEAERLVAASAGPSCSPTADTPRRPSRNKGAGSDEVHRVRSNKYMSATHMTTHWLTHHHRTRVVRRRCRKLATSAPATRRQSSRVRRSLLPVRQRHR